MFNTVNMSMGIVWYISRKYVPKVQHKNMETVKEQYMHNTSIVCLPYYFNLALKCNVTSFEPNTPYSTVFSRPSHYFFFLDQIPFSELRSH